MIRYDWRIWVLVIAMTLILAGITLAAGIPCPAKGQACWKVRAAVATFGEAAAESHARACGWTEQEIAQARRCLRK